MVCGKWIVDIRLVSQEVSRNDIIPEFVLPELSLRELQLLSYCNRTTSTIVKHYLRNHSSLRFILAPYLKPHEFAEFLYVMRTSMAIISGSTALAFFTRQHYDYAGLDIFVDIGRFEVLLDYILSVDYEYQRQPLGPENPFNLSTITSDKSTRITQLLFSKC